MLVLSGSKPLRETAFRVETPEKPDFTQSRKDAKKSFSLFRFQTIAALREARGRAVSPHRGLQVFAKLPGPQAVFQKVWVWDLIPKPVVLHRMREDAAGAISFVRIKDSKARARF